MKRSFSNSFLVLFAVITIALILQKMNPLIPSRIVGAGILVVAAAYFSFFVETRKKILSFVASYQFAVTLMTAAVLALVAGTLVLQKASPADYFQTYGTGGANLIRIFLIDDIFHALWFQTVLGLMVVSLSIVLVRRRPLRLTQFGFLLSHVGIILLLAGGLIGIFYREEGFIDLNEGRRTSTMKVTKNGEYTSAVKDLPFAIQLDDFQLQYYDSKFKIYAYRFDAKEQNYLAVGSYDIVPGEKGYKIPGSRSEFQIVNASGMEFQEVNGHSWRHVLTAENGENISVELGKTYSIDGWNVQVLQFVPHFSYDIEERRIVNLSNEPVNPAIQVRFIKDTNDVLTWYFALIPQFQQMHRQGVTLPALTYAYVSDVAQGQAPLVNLQVVGEEGRQDISLRYKDDPVPLDGGRTLILVDRREAEVKEYRSLASIWKDGKEIKKAAIIVNSPMKISGYEIYQSNYRPEDPTYSGFQVIKDPGLPFIYFGGVILCLGVVWIIYISPRILEARKQLREQGGAHAA